MRCNNTFQKTTIEKSVDGSIQMCRGDRTEVSWHNNESSKCARGVSKTAIRESSNDGHHIIQYRNYVATIVDVADSKHSVSRKIGADYLCGCGQSRPRVTLCSETVESRSLIVTLRNTKIVRTINRNTRDFPVLS